MYEKAVARGHTNLSGEFPPPPDTLLEPPPRPPTYWAVTAGEKVGICNDPWYSTSPPTFWVNLLTSSSAIDFDRIHLLPRFAVQRFEAWEKAVQAYSDEYEAGNVAIMRYAEFGAPERPITIPSTMPTPVAAHKKAARFTEGIPSPQGSGAQKRATRSKPAASPSPAPLEFPSTPTPAQRPVAVVVSSPDDTPPPGIIVYGESDGSDVPLGLPAYPKALEPAAITPVVRAKRAFPLLAYAEECGSHAAKKLRAASEPPKSNKSKDVIDDDLYVSEDWEEKNLPPRGKYFKSLTVQQLLDAERKAANEEFFAKPLDKKGKGKASAKGKMLGKGKVSVNKDSA